MAQLRGDNFEGLARQRMESSGYRFVCAKYTCRVGEIDLIVQSKAAIVFVEVRYRHHNTFGSALESIDWKKQARVIKAAQHFLLAHPEFEYRAARFDVIGFAGDAAAPEMHWIENAFSA